ncbi:MAG: dienelactone hydrolase [Halieaceae bacterium]|jgi:dienelactone hydrolase
MSQSQGPYTLHISRRTELCFLLTALLAIVACSETVKTETNLPETKHFARWATTQLDSLDALSIEALRARRYGSTLAIVERSQSKTHNANSNSYVGQYNSDGLQVYTRIDIPKTAAPPAGFPVVIFVHGWVGISDAPAYNFGLGEGSASNEAINAYVDAGFVVLTPGLRGHGTVAGKPADGLEFLEAWDNGSYLGPMFYAIDVLNLLDGIQTLEAVDWSVWNTDPVTVELSRINIAGWSQGGDAVLTALAVAGEGSQVRNSWAAGSIWSGCFPSRFTQASTYGPMSSTLEAFMSGDGTWTGTEVAADGSINENFVFGYPSDWIGSVDPTSPDWTWQADSWSMPGVADALGRKYGEMYDAINAGVDDINDADFQIQRDSNGKVSVIHDPRVARQMAAIGGFEAHRYLMEPINLHHSDRDYYSFPAWNADLAKSVSDAGGDARDYTYTGATHALRSSKHKWFGSGNFDGGIATMVERDVALFNAAE